MRNKSPRLPFGNKRATIYSSEEAFACALRQFRRPIADFAFSGAGRMAAVSGVRIGDLIVGAAYSDPMRVQCLVDPQLSFFLPVTGGGRFIDKGRWLDWTASRLIISNSYDRPLESVTDANSIVTLRTSGERLLQALKGELQDRNMPGDPSAEELVARLLARGPYFDSGHSWSANYYAAIMNVVALIDDCNCDGELLARIGIEDVVNRLLARLVLEQDQGVVTDAAPLAVPRSARAVDIICDHVRNTIGSPLSNAQMEELTGLTGRALAYAFRARFDCSPQEWQRNYLLDHARLILEDPDHVGSVKALAYELGFSSPSSFAAFYKQRFGELPSQTLARVSRSGVLLPEQDLGGGI